MNALFQDFRYAARALRNSPGFTVVAVLSVGLGIGACTAVFSVVNGVLLRSLPVPNPQELRVLRWSGADSRIQSLDGAVTESGNRRAADSFPYPLFLSLREQAGAEADVFGFYPLREISVRAGGEAVSVNAFMVTGNFFSGLGVRPQLGRLLSPGDEAAAGGQSVVITDDAWERYFARDRGVVGRSVTLNGPGYTVVGVLPRGFAGAQPAHRGEFYVPMQDGSPLLHAPLTTNRHWFLRVMARLKPGSGDDRLAATANVVFAREAAGAMNGPQVLVEPGARGPSAERERYRKPLLLMLGVGGMVMLVACANLAGLLLARRAARQHELAVRAAIGAGRLRLVRQSLVESVVLALLGGGLGVLLAAWGRMSVSRLLAGSAEGLPHDMPLDLWVLGFTLAAALATALASGLLPALWAGRVDPVGGLKARGATAAPRLRAGRALVATQVGLSLLLLSVAGLYLRTLLNLNHVDAGFDTDRLLVFRVGTPGPGYDDAQLSNFYARVQDSLASLPGARGATLIHFTLLDPKYNSSGGFTFPGRAGGPNEQRITHRLVVGEPFFETAGVSLVHGQAFTAADTEGAPKVVVVNETFARQFLPGENALGQVINIFNADWRIVGVCGDIKHYNLKDPAPPVTYFPFRQFRHRSMRFGASFAVRTSGAPLALADAARQAVAAIDPAVPVAHVTTQDRLRDATIAQERLFATLGGVLATLALVLSCVGLYGLMAYNVTRRGREIAVRMAVGARRGDVARAVVREAMALSAVGIGLALPAVFVVTRLIESQLFEVKPNDPATIVGVVGVLAAATVLAAWWPARRATRVDPMVALRHE